MDSKVVWVINQYGGSRLHGMTFRSYYLAKEFVKKHKVYLFSASYSHVMSTPPKISGNLTQEDIDGIIYAWLKVAKYKGSKSIGRIWSMFMFLFRLFTIKISDFQKPDVIIVSSISPFPVIKAFFWARKYNAKLIFEVRDIWPLSIIELGGFSRFHPFVILLQYVENFAYRVSDYVVSVLPKSLDHMQHHGLSKDRFVHIPNGIDIGAQKDELIETIAEKIPKNKFIIAYAGAIGIANSVISLIEAATILKNHSEIAFVIVGDGDQKEKIKEKVNLESLVNVHIFKPIEKTQIHSLLQKVDACFIGLQNQPLFKFGISPNKMFDYLYSGKPIIQAINAGNDLVKESGAGISVEPANPQKIADAILQLYHMSAVERNKMGENGRKFVEKHHSYEKLAATYERLFN